jgi:inosine/xanthosine triphosphate pyrophosphatase family protein
MALLTVPKIKGYINKTRKKRGNGYENIFTKQSFTDETDF